MAEKRMFARKIISSARFLKMPVSSRLLYYDLGMAADDEGVVEAYSVIQATGASEDDLRVLANKGFIQVLNEDLVTFILDWRENNLIRKDRFRKSIYHNLLVKFNLGDKMDAIEIQEEMLGIPMVDQRLTEIRLGKVRLEENSINTLARNEIVSSPDTIVIVFPLKNGKQYNVTRKQIDSFKSPYPNVDLDHQFILMKAWLENNVNRQKTASGISRFINSWLSRASKNEKVSHSMQRMGDEYVDMMPVYDDSKNPKVDAEEINKLIKDGRYVG